MRYRLFCVIVLGVGLCCLATAQSQQTPQPLKLVQTIPLPAVQGRIDHLSIDVKGKRLFLAALGNKTVEVMDLASGKLIHTIGGLKKPQGVLYVPESNQLFVADGEQAACYIYDGSSYKLIRTEPELKDAHSVGYDGRSANTYGVGLVHVGFGSGTEAGIIALDSKSGKPMFEIPVDGHPESIQFLKASNTMYVSIPTAGYIAVAGSGTRRVSAKWPVQGFKDFFPLALDETNQRLFIGSRNPPALVIFDTKAGRMVTSVESVGQTDGLSYDPAHKRLYMSGADGMIGVIEQRDADHYALVAKVPSSMGAGSSLFVPELNRLYVAAPRNATQSARVLVHEVQP